MTEHEMSLAEKIRAELGVSTWQWLQPHDEREALFWVTGAELVEVAVAIAQDNSAAVQGFLARGELKRSEGRALEGVAGYHVAIVQPFVLASPLPEPPA